MRRDTFRNQGEVEYDPVTTVLSDQQIVLYQTYDTTGRIQQKKAWLFVRQ